MVSGQLHSQDALQKDWWKTDHGDRPCLPRSSKCNARAKMSFSPFIPNRGNPLYSNRSSACKDVESLVTPDRLNIGSPRQSSWIQRLLPESVSLGLDHWQNPEVTTGDHGLLYLPSGSETKVAPSSRGDFVEQPEGHPYENNYGRIYPIGDRLRKQTLNGFGSNPYDINYGMSEEPPFVQPEEHVYPIQLPTVESLRGHPKKRNEREISFTSMDTDSRAKAKPSAGTRLSNGLTQSRYFPRKTRGLGVSIEGSNCLGLAAAGKMSGFRAFSVANQSHSIPDSFIKAAPIFVSTKETSSGVREHNLIENMNIAHVSASAGAYILSGRDYYMNEPVCRRRAHGSDLWSVDNQAESRHGLDTELRLTTLRVDDTLSTKKLQSVGSKSFLFEGGRTSVYSGRDCGESLLSQAVGTLSCVSLGTTKNLEESASKTEYYCRWKSHISEFNAASKSNACASAEKGNASNSKGLAIGMIMPHPPCNVDFSTQICDFKCAKPVLGGVMPDRCFQLELCASQGFQSEQLGTSAFIFEDVPKKSDVGTAVIEWPAIKDKSQQQTESWSSTESHPPELCGDLIPMNILTEAHCSLVISERSNRGELRSAIGGVQPCSQSFEMDGFSEGDSASCWHSHQKPGMDAVLYGQATNSYCQRANGAQSHETEPAVSKEPQQQKLSLILGLGGLSGPEFGTGIELVEDEKLEYNSALERISKQSNLLVFPHVKHSALRSDESGPKNSMFFERLQNAPSADSKLQTAGDDSEPLLRDASFRIGHLMKAGRRTAVGHLNLLKSKMNADRHSRMTNNEHEDVPSSVLGKRSWVEEWQVARSMFHTASDVMGLDDRSNIGLESRSKPNMWMQQVEEWQGARSMFHTGSDVMGLDADRSNIGSEFWSKPNMWMQRWCPVTSMMKIQNSSILDKEPQISVVDNGKSQHHQSFRYLRGLVNQDSGGNAYCDTREILTSENRKRRCNMQHETSMVVSDYDLEATRSQNHVNRKQSHFMKRFFTPSTAAMAIIGTTARQIHATKQQNKGLFGVWSSPKDHKRQPSEPQDAAFNSAGSKSEFTEGFMRLSAEYPVTPACV